MLSSQNRRKNSEGDDDGQTIDLFNLDVKVFLGVFNMSPMHNSALKESILLIFSGNSSQMSKAYFEMLYVA